jgi:hypothetical protein
MSNINIFPNQPNKVNVSDNQGSITVTEEGHPSVIISIPENNVITVATPGPRGATGADGTDGADGSSMSTGSLLITGSVSSNVLTFEKGDGSTFSLTVDTGSNENRVTVSDSAPSSPSVGDLWWKSNNGNMYIYYDGYWVVSTDTTVSLPPNIVSSSRQIASEISGAFDLPSSSFASTVTNIIDGTQLVGSSSYAITASYALNGGVGTTDYISNVNFTDGDLVFTGTGNAFNSSVDLDGRYVLAGGGSGGALASRQEITGSTSTLANEASESLDITGYRGYALYSIETDRAAWVRLYTNTGSRDSDQSRNYLTDPLPDAGVIAEIITTGAEKIQLSPAVIGFNNEGTPTSNIPTTIQNRSGVSSAVSVTLTLLQMEA